MYKYKYKYIHLHYTQPNTYVLYKYIHTCTLYNTPYHKDFIYHKHK